MPKTIVINSERGFRSPKIWNFLEGLALTIYLIPPKKSEESGTVERVNCTIRETFRCLECEQPDLWKDAENK